MTMNWKNWIIILLIALNAGWMLYDGIHALTIGDYIVADTGDYAGQLGPWSRLVKAIGLEPRSSTVKMIFVLYGIAALSATIYYALGLSWSQPALFAVCVLGLWNLPVGTVANIISLMLLFITRR